MVHTVNVSAKHLERTSLRQCWNYGGVGEEHTPQERAEFSLKANEFQVGELSRQSICSINKVSTKYQDQIFMQF